MPKGGRNSTWEKTCEIRWHKMGEILQLEQMSVCKETGAVRWNPIPYKKEAVEDKPSLFKKIFG